MKKYTILLFSLFLLALTGSAQPKFASKARKGIVSINTYDQQGNLLRQGTAFYVGADGEAVADYKTFKGAYKAIAVDASGKQEEVERILGADDTYSLVRFRVKGKGGASLTPPPPVSR